jgi:hypothetical protein
MCNLLLVITLRARFFPASAKSGLKGIFHNPRICIFWVCVSCCSGLAAEAHKLAGTEEFPFLSMVSYARPAGLAGAYMALAEGIDAIGTNPAGLALLEKEKRISTGLKKSFLEVHNGEFSYPFTGPGGLWYATSVTYANFGIMPVVNSDGMETGKEFSPSNHTFSVTAAREFSRKIRAGATFKLPTEYLGGFDGSQLAVGWALDAGLQYQPNTKQFAFGIGILNLGRKEVSHTRGGQKRGMLPLELRGGMVYHSLGRANSKVVLDVCVPYHYYLYLAGGIEHTVVESLTLRLGTRFNLPTVETAFRKYVLSTKAEENTARNALKLAAGFSFTTGTVILDYAAQYWHLLGIMHYVTMKWRV